MKFLPTVDLWNSANIAALLNGQLKLQKGQWVKCGSNKPSRFVKVTRKGGSVYAVHPEGEKGVTNERFSEACKCW